MIRTLRPAEAGAAADLWLEANLQAHGFIPAAYWQSHREAVQAALAAAEVFVYVEHDRLLGLIGLDGGDIEGLFVRAEARRRGVGKQLLDFVKTRRTALRLSVYRKNEGAVRFYRREGFSSCGAGTDPATGEAESTM